MRHLILGTAGHIDHGKTALVKALTGVDTDRLPEEKRRGVTIELGFAHLDVGDVRFGVVDVPGHERFVRTMVSGASGIDIALLVVAADDSVMPQTIEHVEILELLGVSRGVVAITKADLADEDMVALVAEEVAELLEGGGLAGAEMVPVSSHTGRGLEELRAALARAAASSRERLAEGPFRLAVDRAFSVAGRGTVVTGSVLQGTVQAGQALQVWPGGREFRVRGLQTHSESAELVCGGERAAINLVGIDKEHLARGFELATPGFVTPTQILDARVTSLGRHKRVMKSRCRLRLCIGTHDVLARLVTPDGKPLLPGQSGFAQLRLAGPVQATYGQRFILRDENDSRTLAGGAVLRSSAKRRPIRGEAALAALQAMESAQLADRVIEVLALNRFSPPAALHIAAQAGVDVNEVPSLLGELAIAGRTTPVDSAGTTVPTAVVEGLLDRAARWLKRFHAEHPTDPGVTADVAAGYLERKSLTGLGKMLLERLIASKRAVRRGRYVCHPEYAPQMSAQDERVLEGILAEYDRAGFAPVQPGELEVARQANRQRLDRLIKIAVANGQLVEIQSGLYLHSRWAEELRQRVADLIRGNREASVSEIRQELGSSRKYVVPFLEYLDRTGFTRREGDRRVLV